MSEQPSLTRDYFETLYHKAEDPWSFATSAYEDEKYTRSIEALGAHYDRALEIGCSIGVFTRRLAPRCGELLAVDISDRALQLARERCADQPQVHVAHAAIPGDFPAGHFDLITCCEVAYYWSDADLSRARDRIADALAPGADLLLVHWLPKVDDYVRDGDAVHEAFLTDDRFAHVTGMRAQRYRLDLMRRR